MDDIIFSLPEGSLIETDKNKDYKLNTRIASIKGDEWEDMVYITRVSYAVSRKWIDRPYKDVEELVESKPEEFKEVTNYIFHDAVESVARIWYKAWRRFVD